MKFFIKFLLLLLVLGMAGPFFLKRPDGKPWLTMDQVLPNNELPNSESLKSQLSYQLQKTKQWILDATPKFTSGSDSESSSGSEATKVYRWKGSDGSWQLSDQPPADGQAEMIMVDPNTNLIQGLSEPVEEEIVEQTPAQEPSVGVPLPMTVPLDQVSKLQEDAKKVQEQLNKRNEALEEAVNGTGNY